MLFYYLLLALGISIDSLGIGFTYGIKSIKFSIVPNLIVCTFSVIISSIFLFVGSSLSNILSESFSNILGSLILTAIGIWIIFHPANSSDFDNSKSIDFKEAFCLGFALSLDTIGICIGIGTLGYSSFVFCLLIGLFNILFLNLGIYFGKKIKKKIKIPETLWNVFSGILLIAIGLFKFF